MIYKPLSEIMVTEWERVQYFNEPRIMALIIDLSAEIHPGATHTIVRPREKLSILRLSSLLTNRQTISPREVFEVTEASQDSKNMDFFYEGP